MISEASVFAVRDLRLGETDLSFAVPAGEILAVLGDNGSGKSLLLAHLSGHLRTPAGTVQVDGRDLRVSRNKVGVVFQHPGLIRHMTVFENVALPFLAHGLDLDGALEKQVRLRLALVGCAHLADQDVNRLSEGDKRCVALARALSGSTRWLVADEPTAALSPAKKNLVEDLLTALVQAGALAGLILATQDWEFARRVATQFLVLRANGAELVDREKFVQHQLGQSRTGGTA